MSEMIRFVYPYVDKFFERKGIMNKAKQLRIAHSSEDGGYWFGIREAIENYCDEYHYSLKDITWKIMVKPDDYDYATIKAENIDDWERQFNDLKVIFDERGGDF